ncbi:MAG TPA: glycosyltransferase [Pyrinomonadaceae bacterium]|nr:glycosyltransferase [Pyrinomonadaceae bacterium]
MKVLHLLDSVNRGGAETQVLDVCRNAARFGLEMTLVAAGGGVMEDEFRNSGAEYVRLDRKLPIDPMFARRLKSLILERGIEVVHGYQAVEGIHLYLATRGLRNVRTVLSFQGFVPGTKNRLATPLIAPLMDANISVSRSLMNYLRDEVGLKGFGNFHVVYNGADEQRLASSGRSIKQELGLADGVLLGAMVANFVADPTKDQLTICRALPHVVKQLPNLHFLFVGRVSAGAESMVEECRSACEEAASNVHFLGARTDVADILAELDLFVFSSRREGFPVAISEAMLAGVPMIVSDIEPLIEATANGEYAEVFPVGNVEALGRKMIDLLDDEARRNDLAERGCQYARENFSIEAHMTRLKEVYASVRTR